MDLMRARVTLRERALSDVLDLALRFTAQHVVAYAKVALLVLVPCFALSYAAADLGNWWLGWTVTVALTSFASAPFVALASRLVFAEEVTTREALGMALRRLPALVGIRLLQLLALAASLLLGLLPWIWIGSVLLFVVEVAVLEQAGPIAAFGRAQRVANAYFGSAIGAMFLTLLGPAAAALLADVAGREVLQTLLEIRPPLSMFRVGGSWMALAGWWSVVPLLATARFFTYLDIRTRTEGWDIQTRFAAIAAREEAEPAERRAA